MKFSLIDEWKKFYTLYSFWFFVALGSLPDLFNLAVQYGVIQSNEAPAILARAINIVAFMGVASRLISQRVAEKQAQNQPSSTKI